MRFLTNVAVFLGTVTVAAAVPAPGGGLPVGLINPFSENRPSQSPPPNMHKGREDFENIDTDSEDTEELFTDSGGAGLSPGMPGGTHWNVPSSKNEKQGKPGNLYYEPPAERFKNGPGESPTYNGMKTYGDDNGTMAAELFARPFTHDQYYRRNFLWIRCRTSNTLNFDVGGSWPGPKGESWKKALKGLGRLRTCTLMNWSFSYVNGKDWGDAVMGASWFEAWCDIRTAVDAAIDISRTIAYEMKRELYIFSCPGYEHMTNYYNEAAEWAKYGKGKNPEFAKAKGSGPAKGSG